MLVTGATIIVALGLQILSPRPYWNQQMERLLKLIMAEVAWCIILAILTAGIFFIK